MRGSLIFDDSAIPKSNYSRLALWIDSHSMRARTGPMAYIYRKAAHPQPWFDQFKLFRVASAVEVGILNRTASYRPAPTRKGFSQNG